MKKLLLATLLLIIMQQTAVSAETVYNQTGDIFENHGTVMLVIRVDDGRIIDANAAAAEFYGYSTNELVSMHIDQINTLSAEETQAEMKSAAIMDRNYFVFRHQLKDGSIRHVEVYSYPYSTEDGTEMLFSIIHDISAKVEAEQRATRTTSFIYTVLVLALLLLISFLLYVAQSRRNTRKANEQLKNLFDNMNEGFALLEVLCDANGKPIDCRFLDVNKGFEKMTSLKRSEVVGKLVSEVVPGYQDLWAEWYGKVALTGEPYKYERFSDSFGKHVSVSCYSPEKMKCAIVATDISEQVQQQQKLMESKQILEVILEDTLSGYWDWNLENNTEYLSPSFKAMFGYSDADMESSPEAWQRLIFPEDLLRVNEQFRQHQDSRGAIPFYNEVRYRHRNGSTIWVICAGRIVSWKMDGSPRRMVGCHINITNLKRLEKALAAERSLFQTTLYSLGDGVVSTDRFGRVDIMNPIAEALCGWTNAEAKGMPFDQVFSLVNEYTHAPCDNPIERVLANSEISELDENTILVRKDGTEIPIEDSAAPIVDEQGHVTGAVMVFRDYTEKKERQREIVYLSYHDQLTGLYNRRFFEEELHRMDSERNLPFTLIMIDINGLKLTNDAFGHGVGDALLKTVSGILLHECRSDEVISRIGGDEFVILLPRTTQEAAEHLIDRIYRSVAEEPFQHTVMSVSIGAATKKVADQPMEEVFKKAEEHMYRRKLTESQSMRNRTIQSIMHTLNQNSQREMLHSEKVSLISRRIGEALHLDFDTLRDIETAGLMHDIGKITINEELLEKPVHLTEEEFAEVRRHPESSYLILKSVDGYAHLAEAILHHHERWDGTGYPKGLKGEEIPLLSRILAVADAYESLTTGRAYRPPVSREMAAEEIRKHSGTQFDSRIVQCFIDILKMDI